MEIQENVIEFYTGDKFASCTFTNRKHINRIKKLHEEKPAEFQAYIENNDGSVWAKIPLSWVKINPGAKREMTEEQKEAARERLAVARAKMKGE